MNQRSTGATAALAVLALASQGRSQQFHPYQWGTVPTQPYVEQPTLDVPPPPRSIVFAPAKERIPLPEVDRGLPQPATPESREGGVGPMAAGDYKKFDNPIVKPSGAAINGWPVEPDIAFADVNNAILVANNYAAVTSNGGTSWTHVNPYTRFGAPAGGFCCDQKVYSRDGVTLWLLQYAQVNNQNVHRVAVFLTPARVGAANPDYTFDVSGATFGQPNQWLDFPDLAASSTTFYSSANFAVGGGSVGSVWWTVQIADLRDGGSLTFGYARSDTFGGFSYRHARQAIPQTHIYFATHLNTSTLRLFQSAPTGLFYWDIPVASWTNSNRTTRGPDGRAFDGGNDGRMASGYEIADEVGFVWDTGPTTGRPYCHVRVARIDKATRTLRADEAIWSSSAAMIYPSVHPNLAGHVGLTFTRGSPTRHPSAWTTIVDDLSGWGGAIFENCLGSSGPTVNRWGDYASMVPDPATQYMTFVATGYCYEAANAGANDAQPRMIRYGREGFEQGSVGLIVRSTGVQGVPITCSADRFGQGQGSTPFFRSFAPSAFYSLTAPEYFSNGGRWYQFERWAYKIYPDENWPFTLAPIGQLSLNRNIENSTDVAEARYFEIVAGTVRTLGPGCRGSNGNVPAHTLGVAAGQPGPQEGKNIDYIVTGAIPNTIAINWFGFSGTNWLGIPLPIDLGPAGAPGCFIRQDLTINFGTTTNAQGRAQVSWVFPGSNYSGTPFYSTFMLVDFVANPTFVVWSNTLEFVPGGRL